MHLGVSFSVLSACSYQGIVDVCQTLCKLFTLLICAQLVINTVSGSWTRVCKISNTDASLSPTWNTLQPCTLKFVMPYCHATMIGLVHPCVIVDM